MTQAVGSNAVIKIALEKVENEQRTDGNYVTVPFKSGESLTVSSSTYTSEQISKHRGTLDVKNGSYSVGGGLQTELGYDNFTLFAHLVLGNLEEANGVKTIKRGKKLPTFTLEKGFTDINQFYEFRGNKVDSLQLQTQVNGLVQLSVNIKGNEFENKTSDFFANLTEKELANDLVSDLETVIKVGDLSVCASSLNINISNDLVESRCIGSAFSKTQAEGRGSVTGDISFAFENGSVYEKWKNETTEKLEITYKKSDDVYIKITLPKVKWGGDGISKVDTADALFVNMSFTSLVDATQESDIVVEIKSPLKYKETMSIS